MLLRETELSGIEVPGWYNRDQCVTHFLTTLGWSYGGSNRQSCDWNGGAYSSTRGEPIIYRLGRLLC
uniref:Uncharacterized protein n=1 Tax=Hyaloperonospora arabidopsidis (strain Emoy2) TaxID=559515 RepID=M4B631_HYAAE